MKEQFMEYVSYIVIGLEALGVIIITFGIIWALFCTLTKKITANERFNVIKYEVGKSILLGLEILVAADIILTVATEPTLEKVIVLAIIVAIRTVLSFTLHKELNQSV